MRTNLWTSLAALSLAVALTACGGDDDDDDDDVVNPDATAGTPDSAPTPDADPNQPDAEPPPSCTEAALAPLDDGTELPAGGIPEIIISEINPGDFIEVYNTTDAAIDLSTTPYSAYQWCSAAGGAFLYAGLNPKNVVPAKGYAVLDWPSNFTNATDADGQLVLYAVGSFNNGNNQLDFTCWGSGEGGRKGLAEAVGKWVGGCAGSIDAGGSLQRQVGSTGTASSSYGSVATPTPEDCTTN